MWKPSWKLQLGYGTGTAEVQRATTSRRSSEHRGGDERRWVDGKRDQDSRVSVGNPYEIAIATDDPAASAYDEHAPRADHDSFPHHTSPSSRSLRPASGPPVLTPGSPPQPVAPTRRRPLGLP